MTHTASRLQDEIKQTRPFESKEQEAAIALMRTADLVRRIVAGVVEPSGITIQQYNVLRILRGAGDKGLPTLEIADRMIEQTPGITRLIDRLESKGLVARERCLTDRRQVFCKITLAGLELLGTLDRPVRESHEALTTLEREIDTLIELLDRAREGCDAVIHQRTTTKSR